MLDLSQICIGVAVVHQRVQILSHFPDTFLAPVQVAVFALFLQYEVKRLLRVVLTIKLCDGGVGFGFIVPEFLFRFALPITGGDKIVPLVDLFQGRVISQMFHGNSPIMNSCGFQGNSDIPAAILPLPNSYASTPIIRRAWRTQALNLTTARAFAFAASSSRFLGDALVSREWMRRVETSAISSTAARNAASLARDGLLKPLIFLTNWRDA